MKDFYKLKEYLYYDETSVTCNRVTHKASFSCNKYGHEQAFQLACQWREQKIAELNAQGAGYSERHGK